MILNKGNKFLSLSKFKRPKVQYCCSCSVCFPRRAALITCKLIGAKCARQKASWLLSAY